MLDKQDNGWVKLYRHSLDNPIFRKPLVWHYFQYCVLKANHTPQKIIVNKEEFILERGCFLTGRRKAALETGLSERNIRTAQQLLINLNMLEKLDVLSTSKFTCLTVCNYDMYQSANTCRATSKRPAKTAKSMQQSEKPTSKKYAVNVCNIMDYRDNKSDCRPASDQQDTKKPTTNKNIYINKNEKKNNICDKNEESITNIMEAFFEEKIWPAYPCRNGRKVSKAASRKWFVENVKPDEMENVLNAIKNYAEETDHSYVRDCIRFLRGRKRDKDWDWKDWIEKPKNERKTNERTSKHKQPESVIPEWIDDM